AKAIPKLDRGLFAIVCIVVVPIVACFFAGLNLAWTALAGAVLVMVLARRDTHEVLKLIDWHLLVFFAALFVVVEGLSDTGLPDAIYRRLQPMFGAHRQRRLGIWLGSLWLAQTFFPTSRLFW